MRFTTTEIMPEKTNNELLVEILATQKKEAENRLKKALEVSNEMNKLTDKVQKLENYLKSDPDTNTEGVVEKLNRIDKSVTNLETKAAIFGVGGGAIIMILKWVVSKIAI